MERNITSDEYKKTHQERRIFVAGAKYTKIGWTGFRVYILKDNTLKEVIVKDSPYWNQKDFMYKCGAIGTNRVLEITLSIGYALGLKFEDINPQVSSLL